MSTMNLILTVVLVLTKFSIYAASTNRWTPEGRIVGGHEAVPYSHPYLVSLQLRFLWVRVHMCGGTILNKNWILTAGHCVVDSWIMRWIPMDAVAGSHDSENFGPKTQVVSIDQRIAHPFYKGDVGPNDIAVMKTKTPFIFTDAIQPANLPVDFKIHSESLVLAGWGVLKTTLFIPVLPGKLQEVNVTYIPYEECYAAVENITDEGEANPLDKNANICTGPLTGGVAACNGDSGGPLIEYTAKAFEENTSSTVNEDEDFLQSLLEENENNNMIDETKPKQVETEKVPTVVGVVSWGASPCGEEGAPTVYTRVSNYMDFINQHIKY